MSTLTEDHVKFLAHVEAVRYDGMNILPIMRLLGYEVKDGQIVINNMPNTSVPLVEYSHFYNEPVNISITPYGMQPMELPIGSWLVKVGTLFSAVPHSEFLKMEVAL